MRSAIIFLGNNFYYQLYRFYAKTIYGGPVAPYELTHYLYSKASPRDGWTYEEYMQRRQQRMNEAVERVQWTYAFEMMFSLLFIGLLPPFLVLRKALGAWINIDRHSELIVLLLVLHFLVLLGLYYWLFGRGRRELYFRFFRMESPRVQCQRRWVSILLFVLLVVGAFPLMALLS